MTRLDQARLMNPQQQRDLKDLRAAAQTRQQEQLQFLLKRLLRSMDYYVALSVPLERLWHWLEIFESYYPDEVWVRKLLLAINAFGTQPDDSIAEQALQQNFSEPGTANYLKAVYDVTQAMQDKHTGEARVGYMTSAVVNSIMAELVEAWYGDHLDAWEQVRVNQDAARADEEAAAIAYQFWTASDTAALDQASWLEVATTVEQRLTRLEGKRS